MQNLNGISIVSTNKTPRKKINDIGSANFFRSPLNIYYSINNEIYKIGSFKKI